MPFSKPTPPERLPADLVELLRESDSDLLTDVALYAEELAEHKAREERLADEDTDTNESRIDDLPDGVPAKASITIKEINSNRYQYWQWRDGDKIKSKYKGPASDDT